MGYGTNSLSPDLNGTSLEANFWHIYSLGCAVTDATRCDGAVPGVVLGTDRILDQPQAVEVRFACCECMHL